MNPQNEQKFDPRFMMKIVRDNLLKEIMPALQPGREKQVLETACALLEFAISGNSPEPAHEPLPHSLLNAGEALLTEELAKGASTRLSHEEQVLAGLGRLSGGARAETARAVLRRILEHEEERCRSAPTLQQAYTFSGTGSIVNPPAPVRRTEELLAEYFAQHEEFARLGSITDVKRVAAGLSKQTFKVSHNRSDGSSGGLIVRMDPTFSALQTTVVDEFPLLTALAARGLKAIPRPLALETDVTKCGAAFMVMAFVPGSSDVKTWGNEREIRKVVLEVAGFLAALHSIPLDGVIAESPSWLSPDHMCRSLDGLEKAWRRFKTAPEPIMEAILSWLRANQPVDHVPEVLVHGDAGFHNMLVHEGTLTAVLDWEIARLGSAGEDLAYVRTFVTPYIDWSDFLEAYRAGGGKALSIDHARFYSVLSWAGIAMSVQCTVHGLQQQEPLLSPRLAYVALNFQKCFMLHAFKQILTLD